MNKKKLLLCMLLIFLGCTTPAFAEGANISIDLGNGAGALGTIDIVILFALISLAPSLLLVMTSFTRIMIVFSFLRNAIGTQQAPPTQVLVGLAFFLTLFIMNPVLTAIQTKAYEPYKEGLITQSEALNEAQIPLKEFMLKQTDKESLDLFLTISEQELLFTSEDDVQAKLMDLSLIHILPAFITSEIKRAFLIGFLLFIPFLLIDIIVASTLMSMGMVMLPPAMISLPFKIMIFVLVDGWGMLMGSLVKGFR